MVLCQGRFKNLIGGLGLVLGVYSSSGIAIYQNHYGGHYRKKNGFPYNDAMEI
jgi:hypothetical protein